MDNREAFEAWAANECISLDKKMTAFGTRYDSPQTDKLEDAFNAGAQAATSHTAAECARKIEAAELGGYDDAIAVIEEGFSKLLHAIGLPAEEGDGKDVASACVIAEVLSEIADGLAPLGIFRDDETFEYGVKP